MQRKALALLSGGLDSTLAVKVMLEQGIEVEALNFTSPFCTCTSKNAGCKSEAVRVAEEFGIPIKVMNKGVEYLEVVRNPRHGYRCRGHCQWRHRQRQGQYALRAYLDARSVPHGDGRQHDRRQL